MADSGGDDGTVKLIGAWPSPFVMRARIALNIKSVNYQFIEEKFRSKSELLLKSNSVHKKIPVLIHGDKPICESLIIVQYIDEVWSDSDSSTPILPSDPYDRAIARFWAAYIDDKWFPALKGIAAAASGEDEEAKKIAMEKVTEGFALMEEAFVSCSKGKDLFGGDKIGFLDIAFGCFCGWIKVNEKVHNFKLFDKTKNPNLVKWAEKFCADASVKDVMPETEKLIEFGKVYLSKVGPSATQIHN